MASVHQPGIDTIWLQHVGAQQQRPRHAAPQKLPKAGTSLCLSQSQHKEDSLIRNSYVLNKAWSSLSACTYQAQLHPACTTHHHATANTTLVQMAFLDSIGITTADATQIKDLVKQPATAIGAIGSASSSLTNWLRDRQLAKREEKLREEVGKREKMSADRPWRESMIDPEMIELATLERAKPPVRANTTLDSQTSLAADKYRIRAAEILERSAQAEELEKVLLSPEPREQSLGPAKVDRSSPRPPATDAENDLPVRPPVKKRDWWFLIAIMMMIAFIATVTPLAVFLHKVHHKDSIAHEPLTVMNETVTVTQTRNVTMTATSISTLTEVLYKTSTYTYFRTAIEGDWNRRGRRRCERHSYHDQSVGEPCVFELRTRAHCTYIEYLRNALFTSSYTCYCARLS